MRWCKRPSPVNALSGIVDADLDPRGVLVMPPFFSGSGCLGIGLLGAGVGVCSPNLHAKQCPKAMPLHLPSAMCESFSCLIFLEHLVWWASSILTLLWACRGILCVSLVGRMWALSWVCAIWIFSYDALVKVLCGPKFIYLIFLQINYIVCAASCLAFPSLIFMSFLVNII